MRYCFLASFERRCDAVRYASIRSGISAEVMVLELTDMFLKVVLGVLLVDDVLSALKDVVVVVVYESDCLYHEKNETRVHYQTINMN